jgi:hypothetical protein
VGSLGWLIHGYLASGVVLPKEAIIAWNTKMVEFCLEYVDMNVEDFACVHGGVARV